MNSAPDSYKPKQVINQRSEQVARELSLAEEARAKGNEGRTRVCARRAAGILIGEYLARKGLPDPGTSAIDRLRVMESLPGIPHEVKQVVSHLLLRVTRQHTLPVNVDLIAEVGWLEQALRSSGD